MEKILDDEMHPKYVWNVSKCEPKISSNADRKKYFKKALLEEITESIRSRKSVMTATFITQTLIRIIDAVKLSPYVIVLSNVCKHDPEGHLIYDDEFDIAIDFSNNSTPEPKQATIRLHNSFSDVTKKVSTCLVLCNPCIGMTHPDVITVPFDTDTISQIINGYLGLHNVPVLQGETDNLENDNLDIIYLLIKYSKTAINVIEIPMGYFTDRDTAYTVSETLQMISCMFNYPNTYEIKEIGPLHQNLQIVNTGTDEIRLYNIGTNKHGKNIFVTLPMNDIKVDDEPLDESTEGEYDE
jgi:hypothetical protein